jgi:glutamate 5-kinase
VDGRFSRGDVVIVRGPDGAEIARGIIAYDWDDATRISGCKSDRIAEILGYAGRSEMIHRDDLVMKAAQDVSQNAGEENA